MKKLIMHHSFAQINSNIEALKKSVADGKALIASAITGKGVSTSADATHATMAANINKISNSIETRTASGSGNRNISAGSYNFTINISLPVINGKNLIGVALESSSLKNSGSLSRHTNFTANAVLSGNGALVSLGCYASESLTMQYSAKVKGFYL